MAIDWSAIAGIVIIEGYSLKEALIQYKSVDSRIRNWYSDIYYKEKRLYK